MSLQCECGKVCKSPGGLASHQRSCRDHLDAVNTGPMQLDLLPPDAGGRGAVESAAVADLAQLHTAGALPSGSASLESTFLLLAREMDRAEREKDRYGKINTARQLQSVRRDLAALAPDGDEDSFDEWLARMSAKIRDGAEP